MGVCDKKKVQMPNLWGARVCKRYLSSNLTTHWRSTYPNFHVECGLILDSTQAVCSATYSNHRSFQSHIYSKYRQVMNFHSTTQPLWRRLQRGPVERVLGRCYAQNSKGESICTSDCFYDVPLIEFLWRLLKCTEVHKQVRMYHSCIVNWQVTQI